MTRLRMIFALMLALTCALAVCSLFVGAVDIPVSRVMGVLTGGESSDVEQFVVMQSRLPQTVTALVCGAALAVCGLLLQCIFRNPLADPSVLGVNSGAALGVALVMLAGASLQGAMGIGATVLAAFAGAMAVTALLWAISHFVSHNVALLIVGLMTGYLVSAFITVLNYFATEQGVKSYMVWGMGSFSDVAPQNIGIFAAAAAIGLVGAMWIVKPLGVLQMGESQAASLGVNVGRVRKTVFVVCGWLVAFTTAFCGPVAFIGLAAPHIARMLVRTDSLVALMPATALTGAMVALVCNLACSLPGMGAMLPVNAVTPLIGAPIVIYIILRRRRF